MAKTGRPPKPTALKDLAGNPGKRKLPAGEPVPTGTLPRMPSERLGPEAQRAWIRIRVALEPLGLLTDADAKAFELLCQHYGEAQRALRIVHKQGPVVPGAQGGPIRNPADKAFLEHSGKFLRYATEFGMTASSRVRLAVATDDADEKSLADVLFEATEAGHDGKPRRHPLAELVGVKPAQALAGAGFGSLELASTAAREGYDLSSIPGVGPATMRKLEGAE